VTDQINAGCYVFKRKLIDQIPAGRPVSVERETFPGLLAEGAKVIGYVDTSYWLDLGTPLAFVKGSSDLVRGIAPSPEVVDPSENLLLAGAKADTSAVVDEGTVLGRNVTVGANAQISGSVVFDDAVIDSGARILNSVIGKGAHIGSDVIVDSVVVGDRVTIEPDNELLNGVRVFPDTTLARASVRFSSDQS